MTNNINGIDVSEWELKGVLIPITECNYFEGIGDCKESKGLCVDNDNCYFKQLKRLQEENESLKSLNDFNVQKIEVLQEENERLNQELNIKEKMLDKFMIGSGETLEKLQKENEKLKNKNNDLIEEIASGNIDITILQKENEELKADLKGETEQCQKWYQLETDKHFQMMKYGQALEEIRNEIGDLKNINRLINLQKILDTINEVLNDN